MCGIPYRTEIPYRTLQCHKNVNRALNSIWTILSIMAYYGYLFINNTVFILNPNSFHSRIVGWRYTSMCIPAMWLFSERESYSFADSFATLIIRVLVTVSNETQVWGVLLLTKKPAASTPIGNLLRWFHAFLWSVVSMLNKVYILRQIVPFRI